MAEKDLQSYVADTEDVARMLFSPLFIDKGRLSPTAFALRVFADKPETYISVLRTCFECFLSDTELIKPPSANTVYGYALLNVGKIRNLKLYSEQEICFDVVPRGTGKLKSHAGITIRIDQQLLKGGQRPTSLLRIQNSLLRIAERRLVKLSSDDY